MGNAIIWSLIAGWLVLSLEKSPTDPLVYQDHVTYPITRELHLPSRVAREGTVWHIGSFLQYPSGWLSAHVIQSPINDRFVLGFSVFAWRLLITFILSFVQWIAIAQLILCARDHWLKFSRAA